jgi:hypothetical protein
MPRACCDAVQLQPDTCNIGFLGVHIPWKRHTNRASYQYTWPYTFAAAEVEKAVDSADMTSDKGLEALGKKIGVRSFGDLLFEM